MKWIWHKRYDHLNFKILRILSMKRKVYRFPKIKQDEICEEYVEKKAKRSFIADLPINSKQNLEMVCSDACGSFETKIKGGNNRIHVTI